MTIQIKYSTVIYIEIKVDVLVKGVFNLTATETKINVMGT